MTKCPNCKSKMEKKNINSDVELRYLENQYGKLYPRLVPISKGRAEFLNFCTKCANCCD